MATVRDFVDVARREVGAVEAQLVAAEAGQAVQRRGRHKRGRPYRFVRGGRFVELSDELDYAYAKRMAEILLKPRSISEALMRVFTRR